MESSRAESSPIGPAGYGPGTRRLEPERAAISARFAEPADIPAIVEVINRAYRVEEFFVTGDRTSEDDVRARLQPPAKGFLVVDDAHAGPKSERRLAAAVYVELRGDRGYFGMLAVDPDRQGSGLGRSLVSAAEEYCRAASCLHIDIVMVNLRRELPAFYKQLGYVPTGVVPFPDASRLRQDAHLVVMTKGLTG
jgi:GNAT superfamily N-acetyltransferase